MSRNSDLGAPSLERCPPASGGGSTNSISHLETSSSLQNTANDITLHLFVWLESFQKIAYALTTSHATISATEGPEAVYLIKSGLRNLNGDKTSKLTVSGAQKKLLDDAKKSKRGRESDEEEEESDEDEGRPGKKGKQQVEEDDDGTHILIYFWIFG